MCSSWFHLGGFWLLKQARTQTVHFGMAKEHTHIQKGTNVHASQQVHISRKQFAPRQRQDSTQYGQPCIQKQLNMWLITSWGKSEVVFALPLIRPCLPVAADLCLKFCVGSTPSHCVSNWGRELFSAMAPRFIDSDICSVGISEAEFSREAVVLFAHILTAEKHAVTLRFVVRVTLV